ncbi:myosin-9 [Helianthus annuus]|uniref:myosin-9 n=1 Tax=Helianthus annuus TaxID=4232 RepID=UPI000B905D85|nr:myosin-9 [Helianthus annuus]
MGNMSRQDCLNWNSGATKQLKRKLSPAALIYAGSAWDELKHLRQAIGFLVIHEKSKKTLDEIIYDLCPVISKMRVLMTKDSNNAVGSSFLLDDDSSIPFSVDDLSKSMEQINIADIEPPPPLCDNSGFSFLWSRAES